MATFEQVKELVDGLQKSMNENFSDVKKDINTVQEDMKTLKVDIAEVVKDSKITKERIDSLELKLQEKDEEFNTLKKEFDAFTRKNNVVLFKVPEDEESNAHLKPYICNIIRRLTSSQVTENDISDIYRIGKKSSQNCRPIKISFVNQSNLKTVLSNKKNFLKENIGVTQDYSKQVSEERKRLQPMVTAINQNGRKAFLRLDELFVDGIKWSRETIEKEFVEFNVTSKRARSPENNATERFQPRIKLIEPQKKASVVPKLKVDTKNRSSKVNSPSPPPTSQCSTPSRMFPMFQTSDSPRNILSPVPGGSHNAKTFEILADK